MSKPKQSCGQCIFGDFERGVTGKPKQRQSGRCVYVVEEPKRPVSETMAYGFRAEFRRCAIYPNSGAECPCFAPVN